MKALLLSLVLVLLCVSPLLAQESTETPEECRDAAQAWYDAILYDDLQTEYQAVTNTALRTSERFAALARLSNLASVVNGLDYPACMELARQWYLQAYDLIGVALQATLDGDLPTFLLGALNFNGKLGQARGYLAALGVELYEGDAAILFK